MHKRAIILVLASVPALLIAACGTKSADLAARAVEDYLSALVNKNYNHFSTLSCADWGSNAMLEYDSFQAVTTQLENLNCAVTGIEGTTTSVICQGKIIATYNGEDQEFDLSVRTYQVVQQGGEYLVCGYK